MLTTPSSARVEVPPYFTVFGGDGFVGRHVCLRLRELGYEVRKAPRDETALQGKSLGHVIYAIGVTGDFRQRTRDTIEAHAAKLARLLASTHFDSWLYLSSTRIYRGIDSIEPVDEEVWLPVRPDADTVYDLSKLLGEAICLGTGVPKVRIARLSHVYGKGQGRQSFLGALLHELESERSLVITESAESRRDFIAVQDVAEALIRIALQGCARIYNLASGKMITNAALAEAIARTSGYPVRFAGNSACHRSPPISVARLQHEFGFTARALLDELPSLIQDLSGSSQ